MKEPRAKPAPLVLGACLIGAVVGVVGIWYGAVEYEHQSGLETHGVQVIARVTEARQMEERDGLSYDIRYAFEVPGRAETFTLGDATGRENLWAATDGEPEWTRARETGQVQVLYLPEHPATNRLITRRGHPAGDALGGIFLGIMVLGFSTVIGWLEVIGQGWRIRRLVAQMRGIKRPAR